jgi:alkaline phosphatase
MQRRKFFKKSALATAGISLVLPNIGFSKSIAPIAANEPEKVAKNIIFMVSDGMSIGTLTMADLLTQKLHGRHSHWMQLYKDRKATKALMDTASASSLVTDSAAGSSAWGGGVRVPNGHLNVGANGELYKPILQKFKAAGKMTGCVTTVPITHATPAGFTINSKSRNSQPEIAMDYLKLKFDVMLGGGLNYFMADKRDDKTDLLPQYAAAGFYTPKNKSELMNLSLDSKPVMGVFYEDGLPYSVDQKQDNGLIATIPTLAEMTSFAIEKMKNNEKGFAMQVEGGKVDWAAHSNDAPALLYDQMAFDDAIKVAIDFAEKDGNTLVVITTDHGNANPALVYGKNVDKNFELALSFKHSNDWVLRDFNSNTTTAQIIEKINYAQGITLSAEDTAILKAELGEVGSDELYNPYNLPFKELAMIQAKYTSIAFASGEHSGDFVELAMVGPGSEMLEPFVKNTDLHNLMLKAAGIQAE